MIETLWYIGGIVFIGLGIGFSIGWHELGHLIPAKLFGIKVPRYMIGFGPTLFARKRGETEYGIKAIPLGGYITMIGMYPPAKLGKADKPGFFGDMVIAARSAHSEHVTAADANRMFYQLAVWKRLIIMFGGPFMNLFLGVVLVIASVTGFGVNVPSTQIASVLECVSASFTTDIPCKAGDQLSPAKAAGLKVGDRVLSVNQQPVSNWDDITNFVSANNAKQYHFVVLRGNQELAADVVPAMVDRPVVGTDGKTTTARVAFFGVGLNVERQQQSIEKALEFSGKEIGQTFSLIVTLPTQLVNLVASTVNGETRTGDGPISVIGFGQVAGEVAANEQVALVDKIDIGIMNLSKMNFALFAFNMLPLLPLDGGHIAGGIYEAIKRAIFKLLGRDKPGPADTALLMPIAWLISALLILMGLVLIVVDLINPVSLGG